MSSVSEEEDLPCLSPIECPDVVGNPSRARSDHVGISFQQLIQDKVLEKSRDEIHRELEEFRLCDSADEEEDSEPGEMSSSHKAADPSMAQVLMYGTVYLTGYTSLPELVVPPEVQELLEPGSPPDFLVLLPWGPVLKGLFESPTHFQVWLFSLVCYHQEVEVSKQATYLLLSELETSRNKENYSPPAEDIHNVLVDYGAVETPELLALYEAPEPPPFLWNIKNTLRVYGCAVRKGDADLDSTITVVRLIARLAQDRYVTSSLDFGEISDTLSNIFDGLTSFTSVEIDKIACMVAGEVRSMLVAPALCQVIRSGNTRCHLVLEQLTLFILLKYAQMPLEIHQGAERPQLQDIILQIVERSLDMRAWEEFSAMCTVLDYHITLAVLDKDQLSEVHTALHRLYTSINEKREERLMMVKTQILGASALLMKRIQMGDDAMSMF